MLGRGSVADRCRIDAAALYSSFALVLAIAVASAETAGMGLDGSIEVGAVQGHQDEEDVQSDILFEAAVAAIDVPLEVVLDLGLTYHGAVEIVELSLIRDHGDSLA